MNAAAKGEQEAWDSLVARYERLVWSIIRGHRLRDADSWDVFQLTWLRLVEHLPTLRDPSAVGSWLATTTRRECWNLMRRSRRALPVASEDLDLDDPDAPAVDEPLLSEERTRQLWAAFQQLSDACQRLLRTLMADPPPSYSEVSAALDMPIGSIGPNRGRCLDRLRDLL